MTENEKSGDNKEKYPTDPKAIGNIVFIFIIIMVLAIKSCYSVYYQSKVTKSKSLTETS